MSRSVATEEMDDPLFLPFGACVALVQHHGVTPPAVTPGSVLILSHARLARRQRRRAAMQALPSPWKWREALRQGLQGLFHTEDFCFHSRSRGGNVPEFVGKSVIDSRFQFM